MHVAMGRVYSNVCAYLLSALKRIIDRATLDDDRRCLGSCVKNGVVCTSCTSKHHERSLIDYSVTDACFCGDFHIRTCLLTLYPCGLTGFGFTSWA